jgi:mannonate dehydratase
MVKIIKAIIKEEEKRKKSNHPIKNIPMRPDHGHTILHDINSKTIPGYSLLGRMKGLDQLKGIIKTIS